MKTLAELGHCPGAQTCQCIFCQLVRAGLCLECAALVRAEIVRGKPGDRVSVAVCSGSCLEAVERFIAPGGLPCPPFRP